jgi:hypothetical protein
MRYLIAFFIAVALAGGASVAVQDRRPPHKLVVQTKIADGTSDDV